MIRLENIRKTFSGDERELHALWGVDLEVAAGRVAGLIGPSGTGKSTLLRCVKVHVG